MKLYSSKNSRCRYLFIKHCGFVRQRLPLERQTTQYTCWYNYVSRFAKSDDKKQLPKQHTATSSNVNESAGQVEGTFRYMYLCGTDVTGSLCRSVRNVYVALIFQCLRCRSGCIHVRVNMPINIFQRG